MKSSLFFLNRIAALIAAILILSPLINHIIATLSWSLTAENQKALRVGLAGLVAEYGIRLIYKVIRKDLADHRVEFSPVTNHSDARIEVWSQHRSPMLNLGLLAAIIFGAYIIYQEAISPADHVLSLLCCALALCLTPYLLIRSFKPLFCSNKQTLSCFSICWLKKTSWSDIAFYELRGELLDGTKRIIFYNAQYKKVNAIGMNDFSEAGQQKLMDFVRSIASEPMNEITAFTTPSSSASPWSS